MERIQAPLLDLLMPAVVGRPVEPELAAGLAYPDLSGTGEEGQTKPMDYVIMRHGGGSPFSRFEPREVCPHHPLLRQ
jgi:hypothetical protein